MNRKQNFFTSATAGLLALGLVLSAPPVRAAEGTPSDVPADAWYAPAANYCWENDLMTAVSPGEFSPNAPLTRVMVAAALYQMYDRPEVSLEPEEYDSGAQDQAGEEQEDQPLSSPFSDVDLDDPDASAILWAWQEGLVSGYDDGRFGSHDLVTREQLAVILWHTMGDKLSQIAAPFTDRKEIASWSIDGVEWAYSAGLISGRPDGRFDPGGTATRAEGAAILMKYDQTFLHPVEPPESGAIPPNTYDSGKFKVKNGFLAYGGDTPSLVGVDVSSHQKEINWSQVAAAGVDFAMIRAGYRGYTAGSINQDAYFRYNMENALANGLDVGVYFFSQAITEAEAEAEARQLLEWIEGYDITCPVVFDWEEVDQSDSRTQGADGETITACARAFCKIIEDAGYLPMTYGSPSKIYAGGLDLAQLQDYPFWLAHYTTDWVPTSFRYHYHMWQYTSSGSVPGIQGRVDLNLCLTDWSEWD